MLLSCVTYKHAFFLSPLYPVEPTGRCENETNVRLTMATHGTSGMVPVKPFMQAPVLVAESSGKRAALPPPTSPADTLETSLITTVMTSLLRIFSQLSVVAHAMLMNAHSLLRQSYGFQTFSPLESVKSWIRSDTALPRSG